MVGRRKSGAAVRRAELVARGLSRWALPLLVALVIVGCGDGDMRPAEATATAPKFASRDYSVKGYLVTGEERLALSFGPADAKSSSGEAPDGQTSEPKRTPIAPRRRAQAAEKCTGSDDCSSVDLAAVDAALPAFNGETLLMAVADSCWRSQGPYHFNNLIQGWTDLADRIAAAAADPSPENLDLLPRVWTTTEGEAPSWFVFKTVRPNSELGMPALAAAYGCDEVLAKQEALLCTASRLSEIADAVTTTEFAIGGGRRWEFPVQDIKDTFILRDLALSTLAHLALLEMELPGVPGVTEQAEAFREPTVLTTCSDIYVRALELSTLGYHEVSDATHATVHDWLPKLHTSGTNNGDLAEARKFIAMRGGYKVNIYRAAGRLLRDLLDKSVQADIAGAERRRAGAGDPALGLELMWGADPNDEASRYNSMRHALRVLLGRLDWMNRATIPQQRCGALQAVAGAATPDGLLETLGQGFSGRWADRPPQTAGQSLGLSLATRSGILLPAAGSYSDADVVKAVSEQLQIISARERGTTVAELALSGGAAAIGAAVERIAPADLRFGLERNLDAYRQLTVTAGVDSFPASAPAGLAFEASADQSATVKAKDGTVVKGGLPRADLHVDMTALTGSARRVGQCGTPDSSHDPLRGNEVETKAAVQSPFTLAHALQIRLQHISAAFDSVPGVPAAVDVARDAAAGAAELRTWAGPGLIVARATGITIDAPVASVELSLIGLKPSELGAPNLAGVPARLAVVQGEAWKADCVAGIRSDAACPAEVPTIPFTSTTLAIPECSSLDDAVTISNRSIPECDVSGYFGGLVRLQLGFSSAPLTSGPQSLLHVVQLPTGSAPGRVLGTVYGGPTGGVSTTADRLEVVSDYQRELLNQVFGTGSPSRRTSTCGDVTTTAIPDAYCIPGMQRDMFVPLSNELTSEGGAQEDSWKHYLGLAEAAAANADELGRQLIEAGIERDLRREGAQEELAGVCGTFADVDSIDIVEGEIRGDENDEAINACLNPKQVDVVMLTDDRWKYMTAKAADEAIRAKYCVGPGSLPKFCSKTGTDYITHAGMAFPSYTPQTAPSSCDGILALSADSTNGISAADLPDRAARLASLASQPYVSRGGFFAGFGGLQLKVLPQVDANGEILWEGTRYGKLLLAPKTSAVFTALSAAQKKFVYPGCIDGGCDGTAENLRRVFTPNTLAIPSHTEIRRRIEAALFNLGAIAGIIPGETFSLPVPVYNANIDGQPAQSTQSTQAPAIFGNASFDQNGNAQVGYSYTLRIDPTRPTRNEEESVALGIARPPESGYWQARYAEDDGRTYTPPWRKRLHTAAKDAAPGTYVTVQATNPALFFNKLMEGRSLLSRTDNVQQWVRDFAGELQNGCLAWPEAGPIFKRAYALNDQGTPTRWWGRNADFVALGDQRNVCHSLVHPVFYEDLNTRNLHHRTHAWHATGGPKTFKEIIEDIPDPNDAMHKEQAGFFEPFSACAHLSDPSLVTENCIPFAAYTEGAATLMAAANTTQLLYGYDVPRGGISGEGNFRRAIENRLQPTTCSAGDRVELYLDHYPDGTCQMGQSIIQSLALACVLGEEPVKLTAGEPPPVVHSLDDLPRYEAWLTLVELNLGEALNDGYFIDFPDAVLARHAGQTGFTSSLGAGAQGNAMLELASQLEAMHASWSSMTSAIRNLKSAVRSFRLELAILDNQSKQRRLVERQEQLRLMQEVVVSSIKAAAATAGAALTIKPDAVVASAAESQVQTANVAFAALQLGVLDEKKEAAQEGDALVRERSSDAFSTSVAQTFDMLDQAVTGIRSASNGILQALNQVQSNSRTAAWEVSKATGSDFAQVDGEFVSQPVNTVLNRQYNILRLRYERARDAAKRSAYLARLAMEQRIGVRLSELREPIGPLPPPATWVENLCSVQGIDYGKLGTADPSNASIDEGSGSTTTQEFANQYIGDYVAQLREFIEFYNVEFPFKEADDQAVLSLREHLLLPQTQCTAESENELYQSHSLFNAGQRSDIDGDFGIKNGWSAPSCVEDGCLYVRDGKLLNNGDAGDPVAVLPPNGIGGISWLYVTDDPPFTDPTADYGTALGEPALESPAPFGTIYQTVPLKGGHRYVLSWWDMARELDGGPLATSGGQSYFVGIYDWNWQLVALDAPVANDGIKPAAGMMPAQYGVDWGPRRHIDFTAFSDGDYHIAFAPSELGQRPASLAIANVQLEEPAKNLTTGSTYQPTNASRTTINGRCKSVSSDELRAAFVRRCKGGRGDADGRAEQCYYELDRDILIDSELHDLGFGGLVGQVGQENFNLRHVSLALNLVGTGVLDCGSTGSAACYASAFVEYDLDHVAFNASLVDYKRQTHCFDFAMGSIKNGKALAAERYITLPLSSGDESLLAQPAFRKTELFGRPLSGLYKLRIKDHPALVWRNLEDIQLVLGHRYWSRVARP